MGARGGVVPVVAVVVAVAVEEMRVQKLWPPVRVRRVSPCLRAHTRPDPPGSSFPERRSGVRAWNVFLKKNGAYGFCICLVLRDLLCELALVGLDAHRHSLEGSDGVDGTTD